VSFSCPGVSRGAHAQGMMLAVALSGAVIICDCPRGGSSGSLNAAGGASVFSFTGASPP
jgi:hypothetical protein